MNARLAMIVFVDAQSQVDPGYGVEAPGGRPDNSLPGSGARPDQGLPGHGHPDNSLPGLPPVAVQLPVYPFDPTIDNSLPGAPPQPEAKPILPGRKFVVKWLACKGLILVPDNSLPSNPPPLHPDQSLPPTAQPKK